jgi:hypothetical protein
VGKSKNIVGARITFEGREILIASKRDSVRVDLGDVSDALLWRRSAPPSLLLKLRDGELISVIFSKGMEEAYETLRARTEGRFDGSIKRFMMRNFVVALLAFLILVTSLLLVSR